MSRIAFLIAVPPALRTWMKWTFTLPLSLAFRRICSRFNFRIDIFMETFPPLSFLLDNLSSLEELFRVSGIIVQSVPGLAPLRSSKASGKLASSLTPNNFSRSNKGTTAVFAKNEKIRQ